MRLSANAVASLVLTALLPSTFAAPQSSSSSATCASPADLPADISTEKLPTTLQEAELLGGCNWKMYIACGGLAAGVCLESCLAGGFADPICDACLGAMGAIGCALCLKDHHEDKAIKNIQNTVLSRSYSNPKAFKYWQSSYKYVQQGYSNYQLGANISTSSGNNVVDITS